MKKHTQRLLATLSLLLSSGASMAAPADAQLIKQGEYLARAGDCIACHTAPQGKPYAGGLGMATPIGKVYSTNITPDKQHGIGNWSFADFDKLMRTGVTKQGYTVYPAMPYPSYSRLSDADMRALYAYLMQGVPANASPNRAADIPWPLSMRFPLTVWRWVFAPTPAPYVPTAGDRQLLRGAYLVQGLGHCGACHTARGVGMQEKALTELDSSAYLAGGAAIDGWVAVIGPAGMARAEVQRINAAVKSTVELPEVRESLLAQGYVLKVNSPEEAGAYFRSEATRMAKLVRQANVKVD